MTALIQLELKFESKFFEFDSPSWFHLEEANSFRVSCSCDVEEERIEWELEDLFRARRRGNGLRSGCKMNLLHGVKCLWFTVGIGMLDKGDDG